MKAVRTVVQISSICDVLVKDGQFLTFYTDSEPDRSFIRQQIEVKLGKQVEVRKSSPPEGGDYGAFFYLGDAYITYHFESVDIR